MADTVKQAGIKQSDGTFQIKDIGVDYTNVDGLSTQATSFKAIKDKNGKDITAYIATVSKDDENIVVKNGANTGTSVDLSMTGASSNANGEAGFVPAPTSADVNKFLKGDGTWGEVTSGVSGVKGSAESTYRTGDVNITKANIGLSNVENESNAVFKNNTPWYATCTTADSTKAKIATTIDSKLGTLKAGQKVSVKFTNTNINSAPTLNVDNKGAANIKAYGTTAPSFWWKAGDVVEFTYDGNSWIMAPSEGQIDSLRFTGTTAQVTNAIDNGQIADGAIVNITDDYNYEELTSSMILHGSDSVANVLDDVKSALTDLNSVKLLHTRVAVNCNTQVSGLSPFTYKGVSLNINPNNNVKVVGHTVEAPDNTNNWVFSVDFVESTQQFKVLTNGSATIYIDCAYYIE